MTPTKTRPQKPMLAEWTSEKLSLSLSLSLPLPLPLSLGDPALVPVIPVVLLVVMLVTAGLLAQPS